MIVIVFFLIKYFKMNKLTTQEGTFYSVKEYAKYKDVSIQSVYKWIKDKKVETKKILSNTFVKVQDFFVSKKFKIFKIIIWITQVG